MGFRLMLTQNPWLFPVFSRPNHSGAAAFAGRSCRLHQGECLGGSGAGRPPFGEAMGYAWLRGYPKVDGC